MHQRLSFKNINGLKKGKHNNPYKSRFANFPNNLIFQRIVIQTYRFDVSDGVGDEQKRALANDCRAEHYQAQYYVHDYFEYLQREVEKVNALLVGLFGVDNASRVPHIIQQSIGTEVRFCFRNC